jgi:hypothetical protein
VGLQTWLDYPTVLLNLGPPTDLTFVLAPSAWLSQGMPARLAQVLVTLSGVAVVIWAARNRSEPVSFAVVVATSVLIAPALYPHYLAIMVLPMLLAIRYVRPAWWLVVAYVLMLGLEIDAFGDARHLVTRMALTGGALLLTGTLLWFGRARQMRPIPAMST